MKVYHVLPLVLSVLLILPLPACDSKSAVTAPTPVTSPAAQQPMTLSGQVFEISPAGRIPAAGVPVVAVVVTVSGSMRTWSSVRTTAALDGRYTFPQLTAGSVAVLATPPNYRQVCGAGAELGPATSLDVEITSSANPQPSPTRPPLRVTGQIYEMTPAGRVGVSGAWIGIDHHGPDSPFLTVQADADGRYSACGIPAHWQVLFDAGNSVYEAVTGAGWHQFSGDAVVDIELRKVQ